MESASKICDQFGVSREIALFFLEGSRWDLNLAMEACRDNLSEQQPSRTLPPRIPPFPTTPERQSPLWIMPDQPPPLQIMPDRKSGVRLLRQRQPPESREELIHAFCMVAVGTTPTDAEAFLEICNWNVEEAIGNFMDKYRPIHGRSKPRRVSDVDRSYSQDYLPMPRQKYLGSSLKDVVPKIDYSSLMELVDDRSPVLFPPMNSPLTSQCHARTGSSSSSMETGKSPKEVHVPLSLMSSPQFNIHEKRSLAQIRKEIFTPPMDTWVDLLCNETKVSRYEALYYLEESKWNLGVATKACRSKTSLPSMDTWIDIICNETKKSRYEALYYLETFKWNFYVAMNACRIKSFTPPVKETSSQGVSVSEISSEMITRRKRLKQLSNSIEQQYQSKLIDRFLEAACGATREEAITCLKLSSGNVNQAVCYFLDRFSKEETTAAMTMMTMGSQNQCYSNEASSSSSIHAEDLTNSGWSLDEAGKEKVTLMASSQVDINLEDKAGEEDSSSKTFSDPCALLDSITLELVLASGKSGTSVKIPFRSDQTVRDIRDAIDKITADKDKDYFLQSTIGEDYKDMNTTVGRIISAGSATLIQTFPDH